ncbi:hypothetical protein NE857_12145 [Nocardiopsis exhalans]|uniref:Tyr recombinase domain-containing protein n=1 Tax=Nocardiopsis exhalans TaxID=163604 RepID=A0ABY5DG14_9ACTN|nr:hypothetical protein [Nocardiopsis exhalans]USY22285.1 hypothetical protein NE857_12145 [Nocardiopsis exhalans]
MAELWQDNSLVLCARVGTPLDRHNVLRELRTITGKAGLNEREWTAREPRHTFVSLLSDHEVSIEEISLLVGHNDTTERVYRRQPRPLRRSAATAVNETPHDAGQHPARPRFHPTPTPPETQKGAHQMVDPSTN